jgi:hypothetical protein
LNERTTRPLGSSESRELATGDRAPAAPPFEPVAVRFVDEAIGVQGVAIEARGAAAGGPRDQWTVARGHPDDGLGLLGGEQIGRIVVTVPREASRWIARAICSSSLATSSSHGGGGAWQLRLSSEPKRWTSVTAPQRESAMPCLRARRR